MKDLKIIFVKFYQAVTIGQKSAQMSAKVIEARTVQDKDLIAIERTNFGVMITLTEVSGRKSFTEIPSNNLAYIQFEAQEANETAAKVSTKAAPKAQ